MYTTLTRLTRLELELAIESHVICDICHVTTSVESHIHILYYLKLTDQQFGAVQPNVHGCQQTTSCT